MNEPVDGAPAVVCDLDGVLWLGDEPLPGAAGAVAAMRAAGLRVAFATNNSSLTLAQYRNKLAGMGVGTDPASLVTSALAAARLVAKEVEPGAPVLACAGEGVVEALQAAGLTVVLEGPCVAVVVGWHRDFSFERLARASSAIRAGARFIATNNDPTYPAPDGLLPGNGALVAAVATASGAVPVIAGKPFAPMVELIRERIGARGVMVGDRASTDGALAAALGWPFVLVDSDASPTETIDPAPLLRVRRLADAVEAIAALIRS